MIQNYALNGTTSQIPFANSINDPNTIERNLQQTEYLQNITSENPLDRNKKYVIDIGGGDPKKLFTNEYVTKNDVASNAYSIVPAGQDIRSIELDFFEPLKVVQPYRKHLFLGKTGSGKSRKALELLYQLRNVIDEVYAFVGSPEGKDFWGRVIPKCFIYSGFKEDKFNTIMMKQLKMRRDFDQGKISKPTRVMIIFEDLSFLGDQLTKSPQLRMYFYQGRHFFIDSIIIMQYCKDFGPKLRDQFDYIYCTNMKTVDVKRKVWELWMGVITYEEFNALLQKYTSNHRMLVFDNLTQDSCLKQTFYWFYVTDDQVTVHNQGFTVGSVSYLFTAKYIEKKQDELLRHCGISEEEIEKYELQRMMDDMIALTQYKPMKNMNGAGRGRGRGKK